MQRTNRLVALLWLAFVVRGFWYCALLPPWEGYDEPYHFAALQHVASGLGMPHSDTPVSLEVQKSLHLLPLPWELQFQSIPHPLTTHDDFWKLPPAEREERINALRALAPGEGSQRATEPILNYESQQAPLYYWLYATPLRWMSSMSLLSRVYLVRFLDLLMASVTIPLAHWIAKHVLQSERQALGTTAIIVLLPELMINVARVGNECLALVCYTAMLAAAVKVSQRPLLWRGWLLLGVALGCGLLTKAYFLTAVPAVVAVAAMSVWQRYRVAEGNPGPAAVMTRLGGALFIATIMAGRWYAQVRSVTGTWSGQGDDVAVRQVSMLQRLTAVVHVNWKSGVLSVLISHVWFGAWSFLRVPGTVYVLAFAVIGLAMVGVALRLWGGRGSPEQLRAILVLAAFYVFFWAGLAYNVLVTFLNQGVSASTGWYLYAGVAAEVVLLVWGLQALVRAHIVFPVLAIGAAALDLYGTHALLMPYYTGLTSHAGKSVASALWTTLSQLPVVFDRLGQLRPGWLSVPVPLSCWVGYLVATFATVLAVVVFNRKPPDGV